LKKFSFSYFLLVIGILATILSTEANAQNVVQIERAREVTNITEDGEAIRKMYDVRLRTGNIEMVCDSAWEFIDRNELRAYGNIEIETPDEIIWTDTLYYYTDQEISQLRGRVVILQDSTTLFGEQVDYNFLTKVADFEDGIRLEDEGGTLIANTGRYFQIQDSAIFRGNVQVADTAQYAEGDSLFINRNTQFLQLHSNIFVQDSTNNALLTGDYLEADSTGRRYVQGNSYLRQISTDSTDTTHINSTDLLMLERDSTDIIQAIQNVRVWSPDFSSVSDTLIYTSKTEIFELISNPTAWHKNIQLNGPYIQVQMDSNAVNYLISYKNTITVQKDSTTGRYNQIKGDTLNVDFKDGQISRIKIYPNSQVLYHTQNEEGEPDGAVEYTSPQTIMYFEEGDLIRVKALKNNGYFFEEFPGLADRKLDGFKWQPELRPLRPEVAAEPRFPPVPLVRPFELPRRYLDYISQETEE